MFNIFNPLKHTIKTNKGDLSLFYSKKVLCIASKTGLSTGFDVLSIGNKGFTFTIISQNVQK